MAGLTWLNQGRGEIVQTIANFFVSLPLVISWALKFPDIISVIVVVIYWVIIGGIIGWLLSRRRLMSQLTAVVLIVALAVSHWAAKVKLEGEIEAAVRAVFKSFGQEVPQSGAGNRIPSNEADRIIADTAREVVLALKAGDMHKLATFVHPEKGLRFSPSAYVKTDTDLVFSVDRVRRLLSDQKKYVWGMYQGSGEPIKLTPREYLREFVYTKDFANASEIGYNRTIGHGNTINNIATIYPDAIVVEYYVRGTTPGREETDWQSLRLVFEQHQQKWYLVGCVHDEWAP